MLKAGDKIALCVCSNPLDSQTIPQIHRLAEILRALNLTPVCSDIVWHTSNATPSCLFRQRSEELQNYFLDSEIKAVFDVSGGNLSNTLLSYIDFDIIKNNAKPFFGYSDLTVLLNAFYAETKQPMYLYSIRNLVFSCGKTQIENFKNSLFEDKNDLFDFQYDFLRGKDMHGTVVGGNIRCFLKLAGTSYFPNCKEKLVFLESCSGEPELLLSQLYHLRQLGIFEDANGIILGTFSHIERNYSRSLAENLVLEATGDFNLPVASTREIGHGSDSKCLVIGQNLNLNAP